MSSLTCVTCRIKFIGDNDDILKATELQRVHFQSDWHRYNLKRKTADLPPISAEVYDEKIQILQKEQPEESSDLHCKACSKKFTSENTFKSHMVSKKHLERVKEFEIMSAKKQNEKKEEDEIEETDDMEVEVVSDEEWETEPLPLEECLFCDHQSETMEKNVDHMTACHGFFIPHGDCVINLEGLLSYLGEKVGQFHVCLWCYCSKFNDVRAIKSHMCDKGHCKIYFDDSNPEYAPFYNYDKLPQTFAKQKDELQIVLPSGGVLGHRDLFLYYKQRAKTGREITFYNGGGAIKHTKMIGWAGTASGSEAVTAAKIIQRQERIRSKALLKVGVRANKLQRHFRDHTFGF